MTRLTLLPSPFHLPCGENPADLSITDEEKLRSVPQWVLNGTIFVLTNNNNRICKKFCCLVSRPLSRDKKTDTRIRRISSCVVDPNTLNLDPDPEFWPNLDPDLGLCHKF